MTFQQLHEILDDENKRLSLKELQQVIYELSQDCSNLSMQRLVQYSEKEIPRETYVNDRGFYIGEQNAFRIILDLLEHLSPETVETCTYTETDMGGDLTAWVCSGCDNAWYFEGTTPHENNLGYCPKCGRRVVKYIPLPEETFEDDE